MVRCSTSRRRQTGERNVSIRMGTFNHASLFVSALTTLGVDGLTLNSLESAVLSISPEENDLILTFRS